MSTSSREMAVSVPTTAEKDPANLLAREADMRVTATG